MVDRPDPLARWAAELAAWAIPEGILAGAESSPWVLSAPVFGRRADERLEAPDSPSFRRALEALPAGGAVLDVGCGAGAAGLPLARTVHGRLLGVDEKPEMLDEVRTRAAAAEIPLETFAGRWPDVAPEVPAAEVVVCHHVLYNVADLAPFALALSSHAQRRVVIELTARHPLTALAPLWRRFHDLDRPEGPTADDAVAALGELGLPLGRESWRAQRGRDWASMDELVDVTRRQLCLPARRAGEVEAALVELGVDPARPTHLGPSWRELETLWWAGSAAED